MTVETAMLGKECSRRAPKHGPRWTVSRIGLADTQPAHNEAGRECQRRWPIAMIIRLQFDERIRIEAPSW